jgi:hypothetical protein
MTNRCLKQADRRPTGKRGFRDLSGMYCPIAPCGVYGSANGAQKVAIGAGFTSPIWPVKIARPKIVVLGLDDASVRQ